MRTVYLGTSAFAAAVLTRLIDSDHAPQLVVSRPDAPHGRGRKLKPPPVVELAREHGIATDQPASVNSDDARDRIAAAQPDAVLVCAFGALIKEPLLTDYRMLNVHPSLLPRWRGAAPVERAIMAGDTETGVSIMVVTAGLDSGSVCAQARTPIEPEDDYAALAARLEQQGGDLLVDVLDTDPPCREQPEAGVTYAEKIAPEDRRLDAATASAVDLNLRLRALTPHIGAYLEQPDGTRLGVSRARVLEGAGPQAGTLDLSGPRPLLGCRQDSLELLTVQPPGKRPMPAEDYLRGLRR